MVGINYGHIAVLIIAVLFSCALGMVLFSVFYSTRSKKKAQDSLRNAAGVNSDVLGSFVCTGVNLKVLCYITRFCKKMEFGDKTKLLSFRFIKDSDMRTKLSRLVIMTGLPDNFDKYIYRETQIRFSLLFGLILMFLGLAISNTAGIIGLIAGVFIGVVLPGKAMKEEASRKVSLVENSLSEMLEVVALGLRSGLSFDRALALYQKHFENELANACEIAMNKWTSGIMTREEALREMSSKYDCDQLKRVVENIIRSLRFGTALASSLEDAAVEARTVYKTKREEAVAKAPVKMMIPTGTLILPAMLLLVLGPVLLELMNGF